MIRNCAACGAANRVQSMPNCAVFRDGLLKRRQPGLTGHRKLEALVLHSVPGEAGRA